MAPRACQPYDPPVRADTGNVEGFHVKRQLLYVIAALVVGLLLGWLVTELGTLDYGYHGPSFHR